MTITIRVASFPGGRSARYLPLAKTEMVISIFIHEDELGLYGSARINIDNFSYEDSGSFAQ